MLISSGVNLNVCVCACLFRPLPTPSKRKQDSSAPKWIPMSDEEHDLGNRKAHDSNVESPEDKVITRETPNGEPLSGRPGALTRCCAIASKASGVPELCTTVYYPITIFIIFTIGAVYFAATLYIVPRVLWLGYTENEAATLVMIIGIGTLLGRFFPVIFVDRHVLSTQTLMMLSLAATVAGLALVSLTDNYAVFVTFSILFGTASGINTPMCYVIAREVTSSGLLAPALGFMGLAFSMGNAFGGVTGGKLSLKRRGHWFYSL